MLARPPRPCDFVGGERCDRRENHERQRRRRLRKTHGRLAVLTLFAGGTAIVGLIARAVVIGSRAAGHACAGRRRPPCADVRGRRGNERQDDGRCQNSLTERAH